MTTRQLKFRDSQGHERSFVMGDRDHLKFSKAFDAFLRKHVSKQNETFRIDRVLTDEALIIETAHGIIGRVRGGQDADAGYRRYERRTDGAELQLRFAYGGYDALDGHGPWTPDRASLLPGGEFENLELAWVEDLRREEERRREIAALPKLDPTALKLFCRVWADNGYNEYPGGEEAYYVLFDGCTIEEAGDARAELLQAVAQLGLRLGTTPAGRPTGEVWVRSDPRVDLALERWA